MRVFAHMQLLEKVTVVALVFLLVLTSGTITTDADTRYLPGITNGQVALLPHDATLHAPGYAFVGATPFAVCAADGTLRVSAYAKRPDGSEGHTVFSIDIDNLRLIERPEFRSPGARGSLSGADNGRCGYGLLSTNIPNDQVIRIIQEP